MDFVYCLAEHHFAGTVSALVLVMLVCCVVQGRLRKHDVIRFVLYAVVFLSMVFLFSFLSVRDAIIDRRTHHEESVLQEHPSDVWTYIIVDK